MKPSYRREDDHEAGRRKKKAVKKAHTFAAVTPVCAQAQYMRENFVDNSFGARKAKQETWGTQLATRKTKQQTRTNKKSVVHPMYTFMV